MRLRYHGQQKHPRGGTVYFWTIFLPGHPAHGASASSRSIQEAWQEGVRVRRGFEGA